MSHGVDVAWVKTLPAEAHGASLIRHETAALRSDAVAGLDGVVAPAVVWSDDGSDGIWLATRPLPRGRPVRDVPTEIALRGDHERKPLVDTEWLHGLRGRAEETIPALVRRVDLLADRIGKSEGAVGPSHGDWAPQKPVAQ